MRLDLRGLLKNASWTSASLAITTALLFGETILYARFLGATIMGYFLLIRAYPEAVQQVLDCRTNETVVKYLGEFAALDQRDKAAALVRLVWSVDAAAGLIAMAIVLGTASLAAHYVVHDPAARWLVALYAVSQFVGTLDSASGSVMRVFDRFGVASALGGTKAIVRFTAVLAALLLGGRVTALICVLVGIETAYTFASAIVSVGILRSRIGFRLWGTIGAVRDRRREIFKFLLHTNITGTLKMSSEKLVLVIIGALGGAQVTAIYKVAAQTGSSIMLFSDPFYQVIYPSLSKLVARREWKAVFGGVRKLERTLVAITIPAAVVASGLMIPLLPLVFGHQFSHAVVPGIVILWAVVPNVLFFWRRPLLLSLSEAGRVARYQAVASGVQLALTLVLVPLLGALGAAVGLLVMWWVFAGLEIRLVSQWRRKLNTQE